MSCEYRECGKERKLACSVGCASAVCIYDKAQLRLNLRGMRCHVQGRGLHWYDHVMHIDENSCIKCNMLNVDETCGRGKPDCEDQRLVVESLREDNKDL